MPYPQVGDRVAILPAPPVEVVRTGVCLFVGSTKFGEGTWVGVELDANFTGKNSGSVQGEQYFECAPGQGIFIRPELVEVLGSAHGGSASEIALRQDLEVLRDKLRAAEEKVEELELDLEVAAEEKLALEDENRTLKAAAALGIASSSTVVPNSAAVIVALQNTVAKLEATVAEHLLTISDLKEQLEAAGTDQTGALLQELTEQKLEREEELDALRDKLDQVNANIDELRQVSALQDEEIAELKAIDAEATRQLEAAAVARRALIDAHDAAMRASHAKISELQTTVAELRKNDADEAIRTQAAALKAARDRIERKRRELENSISRVAVQARDDELAWLAKEARRELPHMQPTIDSVLRLLGVSSSMATFTSLAQHLRAFSIQHTPADGVEARRLAEREMTAAAANGVTFAVIAAKLGCISAPDLSAEEVARIRDCADECASNIVASDEQTLNKVNILRTTTLNRPTRDICEVRPWLAAYSASCHQLDVCVTLLRDVTQDSAWQGQDEVQGLLQQLASTIDSASHLFAQVTAADCRGPIATNLTVGLDTALASIDRWCVAVCSAVDRFRQSKCDANEGISTLRPEVLADVGAAVLAPVSSGGGDPRSVVWWVSESAAAVKRLWHESERNAAAVESEQSVSSHHSNFIVGPLAELVRLSAASAAAPATERQEADQPNRAEIVELQVKLQAAEVNNEKLRLQGERVHDVMADLESARKESRALREELKSTSLQYDDYLLQLERENSELKRVAGELKARIAATKLTESLGVTEYEARLHERTVQSLCGIRGTTQIHRQSQRERHWAAQERYIAALIPTALALERSRIDFP